MQLLLQKAVNKIVDLYGPDEIILFGSYAKDKQHELSDIDLLVIKDTGVSRGFRGAECIEQLRQYPIRFDVQFYTPEEISVARKNPYSFISCVLFSGKIVYKKS